MKEKYPFPLSFGFVVHFFEMPYQHLISV